MTFEIEDTSLPEVKIIRGKRFHDNRGFFSETYKISEFTRLGLPTFVQDNMSKSQKGVIRGLHWQDEPFGQGKLVQCVSGAILDVAVDIRVNSPNFGKHVAINLDDSDLIFIWIPVGFAHGFQALSENTLISYKVTNYWNKNSERSLIYSDPDVSIKWADLNPPLISVKDSLAKSLNDILNT